MFKKNDAVRIKGLYVHTADGYGTIVDTVNDHGHTKWRVYVYDLQMTLWFDTERLEKMNE